MPEYTLDEMREQGRKAAVYFERGLDGFGKTFVALRSRDTVLVAARGEAAKLLGEFVEGGGIGTVTAGVEDVHRVTHFVGGEQPEPEPVAQVQEAAPVSPGGTAGVVVLIPLWHAPPPEHASKGGQVHLHVVNLEGAKLGRRQRASGECLCSKKNGSDERTEIPAGAKVCAECVKVATDNGLTWEA